VLLKFRNVVVNSGMGTVIFTTYDALRGKHQELCIPRVFVAALLAGSLHGALCAPLDATAHRIQALGSTSSRLAPQIFDALRRPLPGSKPGAWPGLLKGSIVHLSMARDGFGIAAFFLSFEVLQLELRRAVAMEDKQTSGMQKSLATLMAGACAGVAYRFASWPLDLMLVSRLEAWEAGKPLGTLKNTFSQILGERGHSFFCPPARALLAAAPSSAMGLLVYESGPFCAFSSVFTFVFLLFFRGLTSEALFRGAKKEWLR